MSERPRSRLSRRRRIALAIVVFGIVLFAYGRWVEPRWVEVTHTKVTWSGPPLRIVVLGDVHAGRMHRDLLETFVARANEADADLVLLAGDYVTGYDANPEKLAILGALSALKARQGVWAVLGNHDTEPFGSRDPRADEIAAALEKMNIHVLRNASAHPVPGMTLVGLGDVLAGDTNPGAAFAEVPAEGPRIVLVHNWRALNVSGMQRFDLAVTAHTHGGQICFPLTQVCLSMRDAPYIAGYFSWPAGGRLYVTRGLGESVIRLRIGCRPEITVLELGP